MISKPSWRKGKRVTQCVYEGPYEEIRSKSTICVSLTMAIVLPFTRSSRIELENRHFRPLPIVIVDPLAEGTPNNINVLYTSLKTTFSGLQYCH